jgi:hypothetical protein
MQVLRRQAGRTPAVFKRWLWCVHELKHSCLPMLVLMWHDSPTPEHSGSLDQPPCDSLCQKTEWCCHSS